MRPSTVLLGCLSLLPVPGTGEGSEPDVRRLVSDLGDRSFAVREAAQKRLAEDQGVQLGELLAGLETTRDEEIRLRLAEVVAVRRFPAALVEIVTLSDGPEPAIVLGQKLLTPETERLDDGKLVELNARGWELAEQQEKDFPSGAPPPPSDHRFRAYGIGKRGELRFLPSLVKRAQEMDPLLPPFPPAPRVETHAVRAERGPTGIESVDVRSVSGSWTCGHHAVLSLSPPRRGPVYAALDGILIRAEGVSLEQAVAVKPLVCDPAWHARRTKELKSEIAACLKKGSIPVQPPGLEDSGHVDYSFATVLATAARILKEPFLADAARKSVSELLAIGAAEDAAFRRRWERDLLALAEVLCDLGDPRDAPLLAELPDASPAMGGLAADAAARYLARIGLKDGNVLAAAFLQCRHPAGPHLQRSATLAQRAKVPLPEPLVCDQMAAALCDALGIPHADYHLARFEEALLKEAQAVPDDAWPAIEAARVRRDRGDITWIYANETDRTEGIARMLKRIESGTR